MPNVQDRADLRRMMVDRQIRTFDVTDQVLLERIIEVPRELFLPDDLATVAYSDKVIEIVADGTRRCLLPPLVLARMLQAAQIRPQDRVLDVAGGFGYTAALVAPLAKDVVALEESEGFCAKARQAFASLGLANASARAGNLQAPTGLDQAFDLIVVNGGVETGLENLFALLTEGGRLLTIERSVHDQTGRAAKARRFDKIQGQISARTLFDAAAHVIPAFARKPEFVF